MPNTNGQTTETPTPTTSPTPTPDAELEAATREANLAEARANKAASEKKEAEAERDKLKATFQPLPTPSITAPTGDVSTDTSGFVEVQILGQEAARIISSRFADELANTTPKPVIIIIYNSSDLSAISAYGPILHQLKRLNKELSTAKTETTRSINGARLLIIDVKSAPQMQLKDPLTIGLAAPAIATGAVKSVAELVQLFRSETNFTNKDISISEDTIVAYLVNNLSNNGIKFYYPSLFPPQLSQYGQETDLSKEIEEVQKNKNALEQGSKSIDEMTIELNKLKKQKEADIEKVEDNPAQVDSLKDLIAKIDRGLAVLKDQKEENQLLITASQQVVSGLETPDSTTKITPYSQLVRSVHLQQIMNNPETLAYTLRFGITANGTTKVKKWLFLDAKVRHSAGARLVYQLFDKDGLIVRSNSFQFYYNWKSSDEVRVCLTKPCLNSDEKKQNKIP